MNNFNNHFHFPVSNPNTTTSFPVSNPNTMSSLPVWNPNTMMHAYPGQNEQNESINSASNHPALPNIAIPPTLPHMENNEGAVAASNTSASRPGRPPGSRNKARGENSAPMSIVLNVPPNVDLINWVVNYATSKKAHLTILCGSGNVLQAGLSHLGSQAPTVTLTEPLNLITMSGIFLYSSSKDGPRAFFNVTLGRISGDIVSGTAKSMITMNDVKLTVTVFYNPEMLVVKETEEMAIESNYDVLRGRNLKWSVVLSFEPGTDVIKALVQFVRYYSINLSVVCCNGLVSEVDIGYSRSHPPFVEALGNFQIISLSGNCDGRGATSVDNVRQSLLVSLVSQNNVLTSGVVVNSMKAAGYVTLVALAKDA